MILIPNYCPTYTADPLVSAIFIFDYRGKPFGMDTLWGKYILFSGYHTPWVYFVDKTPIYTHRMM